MSKTSLAIRRTHFDDLTDSQWQIIEPLVDTDKRNRKNSLRSVLNAILRVTCTGTQWRSLDEGYPPWQSVFYYFRKWQRDGTLALVLRQLHRKIRLQLKREAEPSMVAVDSQSVKKGPLVGKDTGIDGGKNVNGRKRHLAVDSLGLLDCRLGLGLLRVMADPNYRSGADGNFAEVPELRDWLEFAQQMRREFSKSFGHERTDEALPLPNFFLGKGKLVVLFHPFWNCTRWAEDGWLTEIAAEAFGRHGRENVQFLDTFNLHRRPAWCYEKLRTQ